MQRDVWVGNLAEAINRRHWKYMRGGEKKADGSIVARPGSSYLNRLWVPGIPPLKYKVDLTFHTARAE